MQQSRDIVVDKISMTGLMAIRDRDSGKASSGALIAKRVENGPSAPAIAVLASATILIPWLFAINAII